MASIGPWLGGGGSRRGGSGWGSPFFGSPLSSDIWNPSDYGGADQSDDVSVLAHANVDWRETDRAHIFRVDLPGVKKEDLKVQVEENNILEISGERIKEEEQVNDKWHRVERRRGSFRRRFRLPENANLEEGKNIKCSLEHGVLNITVPKEETPRNVRYIDVA